MFAMCVVGDWMWTFSVDNDTKLEMTWMLERVIDGRI